MYNGEKIIAIIPARKGSKRIKNKNGIMLAGKPMYEYSVDVAKKSKYIDDVLFSTDSKRWLSRSIKLGCLNNELREAELCTDTSKTIDVLLYEIKRNSLDKNYSTLVLLQPTSPYRTPDLVDNAIKEYYKNKKSLISVVECKENPVFMRKICNGKLKKYINKCSQVRTQDLETLYRIVGNIYINNIRGINKNTILNDNEIPYIIDSKFSIDIDTIEDLENAETILKENK